jgi:hypothetical protein
LNTMHFFSGNSFGSNAYFAMQYYCC